MGHMADGNSAALRQYEHEQARDSGLWDELAPGIAQDKADDILDGKKVWGMTLADFRNNYEDAVDALLCKFKRDEVLEAHSDLRWKLEREIREWLLINKADEIWETINEPEEA